MTTAEDALKIADEAWGRCGYDAQHLPHSLQVIHLVGRLDSEVNMEGVHGWLSNSGGNGPAVAKALDAIGAPQCAAIVREILAFFPDGRPAVDDEERAAQIEGMSDEVFDQWRELGVRLLSWPEDIYVLMQRFVDAHQGDF